MSNLRRSIGTCHNTVKHFFVKLDRSPYYGIESSAIGVRQLSETERSNPLDCQVRLNQADLYLIYMQLLQACFQDMKFGDRLAVSGHKSEGCQI